MRSLVYVICDWQLTLTYTITGVRHMRLTINTDNAITGVRHMRLTINTDNAITGLRHMRSKYLLEQTKIISE